MRVVLLRHGIAIDREDPDCPPDAQRALTSKGRARTKSGAAGLVAAGVTAELVLTSPYRRAVETAEIVAHALGRPAEAVRATRALLPDAEPAALIDRLSKLRVLEVVCVGHAPGLDRALRFLLDGAKTPFSAIKKAGAAMVELDQAVAGSGRLCWMLEPRMLRLLGGDAS